MKEKFFSMPLTIQRNDAGSYIFTSLIAFVVTVIATRVFLELTGYPQIGNSVLHIAHALWGGLLLIIAVYLPLIFTNRTMIQASAVLGGVGIGLFIDEIGKFITQANDYFFPPALPIIYSFILLNVLVYLSFRRSQHNNPRTALCNALEGIKELVDGGLDSLGGERIIDQLAIAKQSEWEDVAALANLLDEYLEGHKESIPSGKPNLWKRGRLSLDGMFERIGRKKHRASIAIVLSGWIVFVTGYIVAILGGGEKIDSQVLQWKGILIGIQIIVGVLMISAVLFWLFKNEEVGLNLGIVGLVISLVALQLLYFYLSQFSAISSTLIQLAVLQIFIAYRRLYLSEGQGG
jgi:hypothetical protein